MKKKLKNIIILTVGLVIVVGIFIYIKTPYSFIEKAPFTDISLKNGKVIVESEGEVFEWLSAEGESMEDIMLFSKKEFKEKWLHRIKDDYTLVMHKMGKWVYFNTNVQLRNQNGDIISKSVSVTKKNRAKLREANDKKQRIVREHSKNIPASLHYIYQRMDGYQIKENTPQTIQGKLDANIELPISSWIKPKLAILDLETFEYNIKNYFSYATLKNVNYQLAIDAIISDLQNGITKRDFGIQVKRVLALFGDGHSRVSRSFLKMDSLYLPLNIKSVQGKYIALNGAEKLFNGTYPQIIAIDGITIDSLIIKTGELVAKGSSQYYKRKSLDYITQYGYLQQQLGLKKVSNAKIKFSNDTDTIEKKIDLVDRKKISEIFKRKKSHHKLLDGNIGYIYLHKMKKSNDYQDWLHTTMDEFKDTKGIIIDIRGNGGGNRKPIYTLLPYFIKASKVINVNALRINADLNPNIDEAIGDLEMRMAYPEKSTHWSSSEKLAINNFKDIFNPEWKLNNNQFSKWHYSVVSPNSNYYNKPVVVLMNDGNFSASDIFLASFKGSPNVSLIGTSSGGGSGFVRVHFFTNAGIMYKLSRMASFQPNGKLYDGNGVTPDLEIFNSISDYKKQKDIVLERALEMID